MIDTKDSEKVIGNRFECDKNVELLKPQNRISSSHTPHAGSKGDNRENKEEGFSKVELPQDQGWSKEVQNGVSEKKNNSEARNDKIPSVWEDEDGLRNLKPDEKQKLNAEARSETSISGTQQKTVITPQEPKETENLHLLNKAKDNTEGIAKAKVDISMSNEDKSENVLKLREEGSKQEETKEISSTGPAKEFNNQEFRKDPDLLEQLKRLVSNPTPGLKSNINNNISRMSRYIENYKKTREKEISLANHTNNPLKHEDLKEGIKRARFIQLQSEKKEKLWPTIFNSSSMSAPSQSKSKTSKAKNSKPASKTKYQVISVH